MGQTTIEWTASQNPDGTWSPGYSMNFWKGCSEVSPGCDHCYARELMDTRYHQAKWGVHETRIRTSRANWRKPYQWDRQAAAQGRRFRVFTLSVGDFFDAEVRESMRRDAWTVIRETPNLDWLILTKRPNIIPRYLPDDWGDGWPHVALGTSIESQDYLWRAWKLIDVRAKLRFLSVEPLLGPVDLADVLRVTECPRCGAVIHKAVMTDTTWCSDCCVREINDGPVDPKAMHHGMFPTKPMIGWVICGGESGPGARPMHPDWARAARDACTEMGTAFFFKQWGEYVPWDDFSPLGNASLSAVPIAGGVHRNPAAVGPTDALVKGVGKRVAGRLLDGRTWDQYPEPAGVR